MEKSVKREYVLLAVIVLAQLIITAVVFAFVKGGSHSDEVWSYGLANSYYQPFVYQRPGVGIDEAAEADGINLREWISGSVFRDYITVQEGERFAYGSVWSNQTYDHHPPLYYLLLHTVCSLFPDSFSFGYGFFLSCIFLTVTQLFLYKSARLILGDGRAALVACALYAGARAALYTFTFIRQYSLLTMLTVMLIYFTAKLYRGGSLKTTLPPILLLSLAMFMTHYFGIAVTGLLTGCMCLWMLLTRQTGRMLIYGFSVSAVLGAYFLIWPAGWRHITSYTPFREQALDLPASAAGLAGEMSKAQTGLGGIAAALIALLLTVSFALFLKRLRDTPAKGEGADFMPLFIFITAAGLVLVTAWRTELADMGEAGLRYAFCLFPGMCIVLVRAVMNTAGVIPKLKRFPLRTAGAFAAAAVMLSHITGGDELLFKNDPRDTDAAGLTAGRVCAAVLPDSEAWTMTSLCDVFISADRVFVTTPDALAEDLPAMLAGERIDFILIPESRIENNAELEALCSGRPRTAVGTLSVMNTRAVLYRLN